MTPGRDWVMVARFKAWFAPTKRTGGLSAAAAALTLFLLGGVPQVEAQESGPPTPTNAAPPPTTSEPAAPVTDDEIARELKGVEASVNSLKERVFQSKARLMALEEKVAPGNAGGGRAILHHVNELDPAFILESVTCYLDGTNVFERTGGAAELARKAETKVFDGNVPPGNHTITVSMVVRGNGAGPFPYLKDYSFRGQNSFSFVAEDDRSSIVRVIVQKKGGALAAFEDGPEIKFDLATEKSAAADGSRPAR